MLRSMFHAGVAQLVEQLIRNQQVSGSSPLAGSIIINNLQGFGEEEIAAVSALCGQIPSTGPQEPASRGNPSAVGAPRSPSVTARARMQRRARRNPRKPHGIGPSQQRHARSMQCTGDLLHEVDVTIAGRPCLGPRSHRARTSGCRSRITGSRSSRAQPGPPIASSFTSVVITGIPASWTRLPSRSMPWSLLLQATGTQTKRPARSCRQRGLQSPEAVAERSEAP